VYSFINSHLDYCNVLLTGVSDGALKISKSSQTAASLVEILSVIEIIFGSPIVDLT